MKYESELPPAIPLWPGCIGIAAIFRSCRVPNIFEEAPNLQKLRVNCVFPPWHLSEHDLPCPDCPERRPQACWDKSIFIQKRENPAGNPIIMAGHWACEEFKCSHPFDSEDQNIKSENQVFPPSAVSARSSFQVKVQRRLTPVCALAYYFVLFFWFVQFLHLSQRHVLS